MEIDLSTVPAPEVVAPLSFGEIIGEMLTDLADREPLLGNLSQADPAYKVLEVAAYRELLVRQRVNDAARAVMLPYATGSNLENLAALFGIKRQIVNPGDAEANPPVAPTYESDTRLRQRVLLSLNTLSTAGPSGAYVAHAMSASAQVADVSIDSPTPGDVVVTILSTEGDGTASDDLLAIVNGVLTADTVRPLTDRVTVQSATIAEYRVEADVICYPGPDRAVALKEARKRVEQYVKTHHKLGHDVTLSGLYSSLHAGGVQNVVLREPQTGLVMSDTEAPLCTDIVVNDGGTSE